ncbi:MAG: ImmA/IrrE family metallo-endopeptidase [Halofilum sp. (in: g-proteobacteria)]|nr:ImmA/IrrE family metallo-endopeptidase [Halofilum sp. (in: g-proteobacteria)]
MLDNFNPEMITLARDLRGHSQGELAHKLGINQATLSKIEGGIVGPSEDLVPSIATCLDLPHSFFRQKFRIYSMGTHAYMYRKRQKMSAKSRKMIESTVNVLRHHIETLLRSMDIDSPLTIPQLPPDEYGAPEKIAEMVRAQWMAPNGPIQNMTELLEDAGVVIIRCDFGTRSMDATSIWLPGTQPLIFVNKELPGDRWRFTLAHELGHLVMHAIPTDQMEKEADYFAAAFLMPASDIRPDFNKPALKHFANNLKPYWKVSIASLIERAHQLGKISDNQRRYFHMNMNKYGIRDPEPNALPREHPTIPSTID